MALNCIQKKWFQRLKCLIVMKIQSLQVVQVCRTFVSRVKNFYCAHKNQVSLIVSLNHPIHAIVLSKIILEMRKKISNTEIKVKQFIDDLMDETNVQIFRRRVNQLCQQPIAEEITSKEYESIEQIRANLPHPPSLQPEDSKPRRLPTDTIRPFSAQVHRRLKNPKIQIHSAKKGGSTHQRMISNRSIALTNRTQVVSSKNIRKQLKAAAFDSIDERIHQKKLIALSSNVEEDDENDKLINKLRKIKVKAQEYEKQKQNFMRQIDRDREDYVITQKKLLSTLSRKDYTYSYNGTIVEIGKNKGTIKKKSRNLQAMKNGIRKSETDPSNSQKIMINYNSTEFKNERKKYIFEEKDENSMCLKQLESRNVRFCLLPQGEEK